MITKTIYLNLDMISVSESGRGSLESPPFHIFKEEEPKMIVEVDLKLIFVNK